MMRIGILGGTFDPIHYGHLIVAEEALVRLQLARVLFVPANVSPLKLDQTCSAAEHRLRMIELAIQGHPGFEISLVDLQRPAPSYTSDTLALLQELWGPETELYFIMGLDSLATILAWHHPAEVVARARLAVATRPGYAADLQALECSLPGITARTVFLPTPEIGISAHDLRRRVREGLPIRYQLPDSVVDYIREHRLYAAPGQERGARP